MTSDTLTLPAAPTGYSTFDDYLAQRTKQGDRYHYAIALPLVQVPAVLPVPDPGTPLDDNRQVRMKHAQDFATYVRENPDWHAGPLTVRTTSGVVSFTAFDGGDYGTIQLGLLRVPRNARTSFRIVDGQHRVLGTDLLLRQINDELVSTKSLLHTAERNGEPTQALQMLAGKVEKLEQQLVRVQADSIFVDLIIEDSPDKARQIFVDVANNALGISKAVVNRFDARKVVNRALNLVLEDDLPLLHDRVDPQLDRITGSNTNLLGASHLAQIISTLEVGVGGKITKVLENTLDERKLADKTADFFEIITAAFPELTKLADGSATADQSRSSSLVISTTMLRVLAGVHHTLARSGHTAGQIEAFFAALAPHLGAPVTAATASGKLLIGATASEAFTEGATAPGARTQQVKELVAVLAGWADAPPSGF